MTNLAEVYFEIEKNHVTLSLVSNATLKAEGLPGDIERCRPIIKAHKAEIVRHLSGATDQAAALPSWCNATCSRLDIIPGIGAGWVRSLADGEWQREWLSLEDIGSCPESKN